MVGGAALAEIISQYGMAIAAGEGAADVGEQAFQIHGDAFVAWNAAEAVRGNFFTGRVK